MADMHAADHCLATYGTLAPGKPNHHQLSDLNGTWRKGIVRGHLKFSGWGAELGYPALVLDLEGEEVAVDLFVSSDLAAHWQRLDDFEGAEYRRVMANVEVGGVTITAFCYVLADEVAL